MYRKILAAATLGAALAIPGTALADVPVPPPNLQACNGVVVAVGDHPSGAPAQVAKYYGISVEELISVSREQFLCNHP